MKTPFGPELDDLRAEDLSAFLTEPRNEGLTWEGKGGIIRPEHVRQAVCAFANSDLGGYLVLGITQDAKTKAWSFDGWQPPNEAELWIADVLGNGGVDPAPSHLVKAWPAPNGGWVAVVGVRPVAYPPSITSSGEVWERLSGKSVRVLESATLRRLFERGEAARSRVHRLADSGREDIWVAPPEGIPTPITAVCLAAPSLSGDISADLFREGTTTLAMGLMQRTLQADPVHAKTGSSVSQHALTFWSVSGFKDDGGFVLRVGRHGAVAVSRFEQGVSSPLSAFASDPSYVRRMWNAGIVLLEHLGADGPVSVALRLGDRRTGPTDFARESIVRPVTDDEVDSIRREARRAMGVRAYEP